MGKKSKRQNLVSRKDQQVVVEGQYRKEYSGPIPPPAHLEQYEHILPGAAERIIQMAENQSAHRLRIEDKVIRSDIRNSLIGLIFGFIIGILGVGSGFYLIYAGKVLAGSIYGGGTISVMVSTFIYGSRQRRKERQARQ